MSVHTILASRGIAGFSIAALAIIAVVILAGPQEAVSRLWFPILLLTGFIIAITVMASRRLQAGHSLWCSIRKAVYSLF